MVIKLKNPYSDDLTRTTQVSKIIENFVKDNWNLVDVDINDIAWGIPMRLMDQSGKDITMTVTTFHTSSKPYEISRNRWQFTENMMIDFYVVNREDNIGGHDPKAILIQKYMEDFWISLDRDSLYGIDTIIHRGSNVTADDLRNDLTRVMTTLEVNYLADRVNI